MLVRNDEVTLLRLGVNQVDTFDGQILAGKRVAIFISSTPTSAQPLIETVKEGAVHHIFNTAGPEDFFGVIEESLRNVFFESLAPLIHDLSPYQSSFSLLVDRRAPPADSRRYDGDASSFICRGPSLKELNLSTTNTLDICYMLLSGLLDGTWSSSALLVSQLPYAGTPLVHHEDPFPEVALIIPHRHPYKYLEVTLDYITRMVWSSKVRTAIGLDVDDVSPYLTLKARPRVDLYFCPSFVPAGPYVFRDKLIEAASEPLLIFQDSDDVPCTNRLTSLSEGLRAARADMVGSHEIELNEIDKVIRLYRFPLDVSSVLLKPETDGVSPNAAEPFLHATALMKRSAFRSVGGFSTNRRIANDSQFLLRASLSLKIANVDSFLYIRRVHKTALTVAPETQNGNALREALSAKWSSDFKKIKRGELTLANSSLIASKSQLEIKQL